MSQPDFLTCEMEFSVHRGADDLLSAGLGLGGLRQVQAPLPAIDAAPTAAELRRRAIHSNWRGVADLSEGGGYGRVYGAVPDVPGREYRAFARIPGANQPHRVLAQIPDSFDLQTRCLLVAPASGTRGIYAGIALAGAFGLPRACAVVYTDKGAGTGYFDLDNQEGVALDGRRARADQPLDFAVPTETRCVAHGIAIKHAHSQDNPEADWGRHALQAAEFGLHALDRAFPDAAPFTARNTRIIAVGLSNGGGAVLRASEQDSQGLLDAVVAIAPNISVLGARPLYDYATEAALYQPCTLLAMPGAPSILPLATTQALVDQRCAALYAEGLLEANTPAAQAEEALQRLRDSGWSEAALRQANVNAAVDLWRAVVASYAQAYMRAAVAAPVCGYWFAALDSAAAPRATTAAERALWWSDGAGVAPGIGIGIIDTFASANEGALPALRAARALWTDSTDPPHILRASVEAARATARPLAPFTLVVHGVDDGLIPSAFTAQPYVRAARGEGATIAYWQVPNAQHFDAFLGLPVLAERFLPLLPYAYAALARTYAHVIEGATAPGDRVFHNRARGEQPLSAAHLAIEAP